MKIYETKPNATKIERFNDKRFEKQKLILKNI